MGRESRSKMYLPLVCGVITLLINYKILANYYYYFFVNKRTKYFLCLVGVKVH